ncbi:MAG: radical SAM protein [Alphaproteobacteria bacterium]|nr:radical SAM protein [Alphaproteobacteria bacterium]
MTAPFADLLVTAKGETRATVPLDALTTLWLNTGTLCNLTCANCYIESSPTNDRLVWLTRADVRAYLAEIADDGLPTREIGLTGGEPFMNPEIEGILADILDAGHEALVLTNAMTPLRHKRHALLALKEAHGARLRLRVSLDHFTQARHEAERGPRSWAPTIEGLRWLAAEGFDLAVAGRTLTGEDEATLRAGYAALFDAEAIAIDAADPHRLVLFPEMDETRAVPEISTACWGILGKSPSDVMCATSRMVVRRKGADRATVVACTLLPYDPRFDLGPTLADAARPVPLAHPHCARFCVLGGGSCS